MSEGKEDPQIIVKIQIMLAKIEEQIISLKRSNHEITKTIKALRDEQETRFRWTIYLFITLLIIFIGVTPVMWKIGIV